MGWFTRCRGASGSHEGPYAIRLRRNFGPPHVTKITYQYDKIGRPMSAMDDFAIAGADLVVEHSENFSPELPDRWPPHT
jgi:hypothetical protein